MRRLVASLLLAAIALTQAAGPGFAWAAPSADTLRGKQHQAEDQPQSGGLEESLRHSDRAVMTAQAALPQRAPAWTPLPPTAGLEERVIAGDPREIVAELLQRPGDTPPIFTPLRWTSRGMLIDEDSLQRLVVHVRDTMHAEAVLALGKTGESDVMEPEFRRQAITVVTEAAVKAGLITLTQVTGNTEAETLQNARAASAAGAHGLVIALLFFLPNDDARIKAFLSHPELQQSGRAILLYDNPALARQAPNDPLLHTRAVGAWWKDGLIGGFKDSSGDKVHFLDLLDTGVPLSMGDESLIAWARKEGRQRGRVVRAVGSSGNYWPAIHALATEPDPSRWPELQAAVDAQLKLLRGDNQIVAIGKHLLTQMGIFSSDATMPGTPRLDEAATQQLRAFHDDVLAKPAAGLEETPTRLSADQVRIIVAGDGSAFRAVVERAVHAAVGKHASSPVLSQIHQDQVVVAPTLDDLQKELAGANGYALVVATPTLRGRGVWQDATRTALARPSTDVVVTTFHGGPFLEVGSAFQQARQQGRFQWTVDTFDREAPLPPRYLQQRIETTLGQRVAPRGFGTLSALDVDGAVRMIRERLPGMLYLYTPGRVGPPTGMRFVSVQEPGRLRRLISGIASPEGFLQLVPDEGNLQIHPWTPAATGLEERTEGSPVRSVKPWTDVVQTPSGKAVIVTTTPLTAAGQTAATTADIARITTTVTGWQFGDRTYEHPTTKWTDAYLVRQLVVLALSTHPTELERLPGEVRPVSARPLDAQVAALFAPRPASPSAAPGVRHDARPREPSLSSLTLATSAGLEERGTTKRWLNHFVADGYRRVFGAVFAVSTAGGRSPVRLVLEGPRGRQEMTWTLPIRPQQVGRDIETLAGHAGVERLSQGEEWLLVLRTSLDDRTVSARFTRLGLTALQQTLPPPAPDETVAEYLITLEMVYDTLARRAEPLGPPDLRQQLVADAAVQTLRFRVASGGQTRDFDAPRRENRNLTPIFRDAGLQPVLQRPAREYVRPVGTWIESADTTVRVLSLNISASSGLEEPVGYDMAAVQRTIEQVLSEYPYLEAHWRWAAPAPGDDHTVHLRGELSYPGMMVEEDRLTLDITTKPEGRGFHVALRDGRFAQAAGHATERDVLAADQLLPAISAVFATSTATRTLQEYEQAYATLERQHLFDPGSHRFKLLVAALLRHRGGSELQFQSLMALHSPMTTTIHDALLEPLRLTFRFEDRGRPYTWERFARHVRRYVRAMSPGERERLLDVVEQVAASVTSLSGEPDRPEQYRQLVPQIQQAIRTLAPEGSNETAAGLEEQRFTPDGTRILIFGDGLVSAMFLSSPIRKLAAARGVQLLPAAHTVPDFEKRLQSDVPLMLVVLNRPTTDQAPSLLAAIEQARREGRRVDVIVLSGDSPFSASGRAFRGRAQGWVEEISPRSADPIGELNTALEDRLDARLMSTAPGAGLEEGGDYPTEGHLFDPGSHRFKLLVAALLLYEGLESLERLEYEEIARSILRYEGALTGDDERINVRNAAAALGFKLSVQAATGYDAHQLARDVEQHVRTMRPAYRELLGNAVARAAALVPAARQGYYLGLVGIIQAELQGLSESGLEERRFAPENVRFLIFAKQGGDVLVRGLQSIAQQHRTPILPVATSAEGFLQRFEAQADNPLIVAVLFDLGINEAWRIQQAIQRARDGGRHVDVILMFKTETQGLLTLFQDHRGWLEGIPGQPHNPVEALKGVVQSRLDERLATAPAAAASSTAGQPTTDAGQQEPRPAGLEEVQNVTDALGHAQPHPILGIRTSEFLHSEMFTVQAGKVFQDSPPPVHTYPSDVYYLVVGGWSGALQLQRDRGMLLTGFVPGDVVGVPKNTPHTFGSRDDKAPLRYLMVTAAPSVTPVIQRGAKPLIEMADTARPNDLGIVETSLRSGTVTRIPGTAADVERLRLTASLGDAEFVTRPQTDTLLFVMRGSGVVQIGEETLEMKAEDGWLVPPGQHVEILSDAAELVRLTIPRTPSTAGLEETETIRRRLSDLRRFFEALGRAVEDDGGLVPALTVTRAQFGPTAFPALDGRLTDQAIASLLTAQSALPQQMAEPLRALVAWAPEVFDRLGWRMHNGQALDAESVYEDVSRAAGVFDPANEARIILWGAAWGTDDKAPARRRREVEALIERAKALAGLPSTTFHTTVLSADPSNPLDHGVAYQVPDGVGEVFVLDPIRLHATDAATPDVARLQAQAETPEELKRVAILTMRDIQPYAIVVRAPDETIVDYPADQHIATIRVNDVTSFTEILQQAIAKRLGRPIGLIRSIRVLEDGRLAIYV